MTDRNEAVLEQALTPDEALEFLKDENNFRNAANGIRDWFAKKHPDVNAEKLDKAFYKAMRASLPGDCPDVKTISKWLNGDTLPEKRNAIKICFALGLSGGEANEFLFRVCKLNGFNVRRGEDIVYAYCLENGMSYADSENIIDEFKANPNYLKRDEYRKLVEERIKGGANRADYTVRTETLRKEFTTMKGIDVGVFKKRLFADLKYFMDFSVTAHERFVALYRELYEQVAGQVELVKNAHENTHWLEKYMNIANIEKPEDRFAALSEIVFDRLVRRSLNMDETADDSIDKIVTERKVALSQDATFNNITDKFPRDEYVTKMKNDWTAATEAERGFSRKTFVLLFFANEVFKQDNSPTEAANVGTKKRSFYRHFYRILNTELQDCGYGLLHAANPFDWLVLNCVRSFDKSGEDVQYDGSLQVFNDLLSAYIEG